IAWAFSVLDIDLTRAALFVFVSGVGYLICAAATDRLSNQLTLAAAMRLMPIASVLLLRILWHLVGGVGNPTFLIAFALPVIINGVVIVGRQALVTAGLSTIVAWTVALVESRDLRWYVAGGRPEIWHALDTVARFIPAQPDVFPDVRTPPAYQFMVMAT